MATEDTKVTTTDTEPEVKPDATGTDDSGAKEKELSMQDLLVQIARLKRATDKATSEAADYKRKWKESMSEQEAANAEKAEAEARKEERLKELERNEKIHGLMENYMDLKYTKEQAKRAAEAMVDGDMDVVFKVQEEVENQKLKAKEEEWLKSRPEPAAGKGDETEDLFLKGFNSVPTRFGS